MLVTLKGFIGKEEIDQAMATLNKASPSERVIVDINSTGGDIEAVLALSTRLYELHEEKNIHLIVYIDGSAIGPAAIIPLLADELYVSFVATWGDIPLGSEKVITTNILRSRIESLVNEQNPKAQILKDIGVAMSDPAANFNQGGVASASGTPLVLNQNQIKSLQLVKQPISLSSFQALFHLSENQAQQFEAGVPSGSLQIPATTVEEELQKHIIFHKEGTNHIGHISIEDRTNGINQATWLYVKSALDYYKKSKPIFVILELNTPGGEVFAAQEISDALKDLDTQYNIPVVAYINNWAISAGAMLAYSCRFIIAAKDASMGAAEPVIPQTTGELKEASEKINSALRADFSNRAKFFDRNSAIAESMVDKDIILVLRHGQFVKLDNENQIQTQAPNPDIVIKAKGKLLTLDGEQLLKYGVADMLLPPLKTGEITPEEKEKGQWPASKMLLFHYPFFKNIPNAVIDSYQMDWKTQFFVILANPIVSSILFLGLMVGAYLEMTTPGVTLPGSIAAICLFLIILSSFAQEIGNMLEIILLVTGLLIILVELFILPTFGLLGIAGIICFLAGLAGLMLPGIGSASFEFDTQTLNAAGEAFFNRLAWLSATFVVGLIIIALLGRYVVPAFGGYNRFILSGHEQDASQGYIAGENPAELPLPGSEGIVVATLRPSGKISINDQLYDAISAGALIDKGEQIVVVRLEGSVIVVDRSERVAT